MTLTEIAQGRQVQERQVQQARERARDAARHPAAGPIHPLHLKQHDAHRRDALQQLERQQGHLRRLEEQEAAARRQLVALRRAEEALTTLRDQEEADHRKAAADAEMAFLDEQAMFGFHKRRHRVAS